MYSRVSRPGRASSSPSGRRMRESRLVMSAAAWRTNARTEVAGGSAGWPQAWQKRPCNAVPQFSHAAAAGAAADGGRGAVEG
jgi:hypothetical protein